jgi:hypothetical protein
MSPTFDDPEVVAFCKSHPSLMLLLECLGDEGPCSFNHNGGCQAHGYLGLEPGEVCPIEEVKQLAKAVKTL